MINNKILVGIICKIENWLCESAELVVAVTQGIENYVQEIGIDKMKITYLPNGVLLANYLPKSRLRDIKRNPNYIMRFGYIGTMGMAQNIEIILQAAKKLEYREDVEFIIAGDGVMRKNILKLTDELKLNNLTVLSLVPREKINDILNGLDAGIVTLKNSKYFSKALPSKMFEFLALEKPIILSAPEGEAQKLILQSGCGIAIKPNDCNELSDAVMKYVLNKNIYNRHSNKCRDVVKNNFNREIVANKFLHAMNSIIIPKN